MTKKFELYFNDLTEGAQKRLREYDPTGIPQGHLDSKTPLMSMRIKDQRSDLDKGTMIHEMLERLLTKPGMRQPDINVNKLKSLVDAMRNKERVPTQDDIPPEVLVEAKRRVLAGEDVAGIAIDTRDGTVMFLNKAQALEAATHDAKDGGKPQFLNLGEDEHDCENCNQTDCPGRNNDDSGDSVLGSHVGPKRWN